MNTSADEERKKMAQKLLNSIRKSDPSLVTDLGLRLSDKGIEYMYGKIKFDGKNIVAIYFDFPEEEDVGQCYGVQLHSLISISKELFPIVGVLPPHEDLPAFCIIKPGYEGHLPPGSIKRLSLPYWGDQDV